MCVYHVGRNEMTSTTLPEYPKSWKEMSLDLKLFFVSHMCAGVLFMFRGAGIRSQVALALAGYAVLFLVSLFHRHRKGWQWPGAGLGNYGKALLFGVAGGLLLSTSLVRFMFFDPFRFSFHLCIVNITMFQVLHALNVVEWSAAKFEARCGSGSMQSVAELAEPIALRRTWRDSVRSICSVLFVLVWMIAVAYFIVHQYAMSHGSESPSYPCIEAVRDHGAVVYVTPEEKWRIDILEAGMHYGIPTMLGICLLLEFVFGVSVRGGEAVTVWQWLRTRFTPEEYDELIKAAIFAGLIVLFVWAMLAIRHG